MNLVVDASVAVKWLFDEPDSEKAEALLASAGEEDDLKLVAPAILPAEVANALWKRMRRGDMDRLKTLETGQRFEGICPLLLPIEDLVHRALELAIDSRHPVYDCLYVALAEELHADLITADERLYRAFAPDFPGVHLLRDFN
jgi:predicted nucleic acid-binding protein